MTDWEFKIALKSEADLAAFELAQQATAKLKDSTLGLATTQQQAATAGAQQGNSGQAVALASRAGREAMNAYAAVLSGSYVAAAEKARFVTVALSTAMRATPWGAAVFGATIAIGAISHLVGKMQEGSRAAEDAAKAAAEETKKAGEEIAAAAEKLGAHRADPFVFKESISALDEYTRAADEAASAVAGLIDRSKELERMRAAKEDAQLGLDLANLDANKSLTPARRIVLEAEARSRSAARKQIIEQEGFSSSMTGAAMKRESTARVAKGAEEDLQAIASQIEAKQNEAYRAALESEQAGQRGQTIHAQERAAAAVEINKAVEELKKEYGEQANVVKKARESAEKAAEAAEGEMAMIRERSRVSAELYEINKRRTAILDTGAQADAARAEGAQKREARLKQIDLALSQPNFDGKPREQLLREKAALEYAGAGDTQDPAQRGRQQQAIREQEATRRFNTLPPEQRAAAAAMDATKGVRARSGNESVTGSLAEKVEYAAKAIQQDGAQPGEMDRLMNVMQDFLKHAKLTMEEKKRAEARIQQMESDARELTSRTEKRS